MDAKERMHPDLSGAEWKVMKAVWTLKKANVREVYERLRGRERWAYNTVRTLMERLCAKGYLKAEKAGNLYVYQPTKTRRSVSAQALWAFVEKVFDGAVGPLVTQLVEENKLSQEDLEKLRGILDEERKKR
jgi:BlaI family penicillinase repressor